MDWDSFVRTFIIVHTACSVKAKQGSSKETSTEIIKRLRKEGLEAEVLHLPNHNHIVAGCEGLIIDAALDIDYNTDTGRRVFTRGEHEALMKEVASREPFCTYMSNEVVYKAVEF